MDLTTDTAEARTIARAAYAYAFPMLMGYRFAYGSFLQPASPGYLGPANGGPYGKAMPLDHRFRDVVTPNSDTPYSLALLDLRAGPVVVSTPEVRDRYFVLQFEDLLGFNPLYIGSRATGTEPQRWFLMGPSYGDEVPGGYDGSHRFETELVFVLGRTQLLGPDDADACGEVMAGYALEAQGELPAAAWPVWVDEASRDERFIGYLNALLPLCRPIHPDDAELVRRMAAIGIAAGASFDVDALDPELRRSIRAGVDDARADMSDAFRSAGELVNGWSVARKSPFGDREALAGDDFLRAGAAMAGWGGNDLVEASYPRSDVDADGRPYDGAAKYQMCLATPPPVRAFWSVTMYDKSYDGESGYLVENPIGRYLINSNTQGLVADDDGALTITMQRGEPSDPVERANWLPTPEGSFYLILRLYWPEQAALDGTWEVPGVHRVG